MEFEFAQAAKRREDERRRAAEKTRRQEAETRRLREAVQREEEEAARKNNEIKIKKQMQNNRLEYFDIHNLRPSVNNRIAGNRVILHESLLGKLTQSGNFPIFMEIQKTQGSTRPTHCGVLEFTASREDEISMSQTLLNNLGASSPVPGDSTGDFHVHAKIVTLPKISKLTLLSFSAAGNSDSFKPRLENFLRENFPCLTVGDEFTLDGVPCKVASLAPESAGSLIDTDVELQLELAKIPSLSTGEPTALSTNTPINFSSSPANFHASGIQRNFKLIVKGRNLRVFGSDGAGASAENFEFMADYVDGDAAEVVLHSDEISVHVVGASNSNVAEISIVPVSRPSDSSVINGKICGNCGRDVPHASFDLHEVQCERKNWLCGGCGRIFPRNFRSRHSHCSTCTRGFTDMSQLEHDALWHSETCCPCGEKFPGRDDLVHHKRTSCPVRSVLCRYCGVVTPQGFRSRMDAKDRFEGLQSEHEGQCGNRTDRCDQCGKILRLKDMDLHFRLAHRGNGR